ncbi:MAG: alpha/beta hydrolase fold domain-containing protein, partial [Rhizobiales bacterium]|nr:alpha/beta hydrolase fold domain-containing protein [Hyphomicrobiales bacterium]
DRGGIAIAAALDKHVPAGVTARRDERYDTNDPVALLDVYFPSSVDTIDRMLPAIVWVHGGGFISGNKDQIANYLKILAARGYTAIGVNYSLAPGSTYPTPIKQVNAALAYLQKNASRLHIDPSKLFLAGDSAGAQIAAQTANVISSPGYAHALGMAPAIARSQLRGVILYCGLYDPRIVSVDGPFGGLVRSVAWSYFGVRDFFKDPRLAQFSVVGNLTADFPPIFISVGNDDPLAPQSHLLAKTAVKLGVPVDSLFFLDGYKPPLPHEYQFNLDVDAGRAALERTVQFLNDRSR